MKMPILTAARPAHRGTLLALLVLAVVIPTEHALASRELPIQRVHVEGDGVADQEALIRILGLEEGRPINRHRLRESILAIYASGEVERIRVDAETAPDFVDVTVTINMRSKISKIQVKTSNPILRNQIKKWLQMTPGDAVSFSNIEAGNRRVLRKLREKGHVDPDVEVFVDFHRSTNTVDITVEARPGELELVGPVIIQGIDDPEVARSVMPKTSPDAKLGTRTKERMRTQVEENLRRQGFWDGRVMDVDRGTVDDPQALVITVDPGPFYQLELVTPPGMEKVVSEAFPDPVEEDVHPAQTEALAERIRENLQDRGHLLATVTTRLEIEGPSHLVRVEADPGGVRRIASVEFPGAVSVDRDELGRTVRVEKGKTSGLGGQAINDTTLGIDRRLLEEKYRFLGYVDVEVGEPVIEAVGAVDVRVVFPVEEGQQWIVSDVRIEGLPVEAAARLETTQLALEKAAPWNPSAAQTTTRQLELILADSGYPEGIVTHSVDDSQLGVARVVFTIDPGGFAEIGEVVVAGLRKTRPSVVKRALRSAGVLTGEPFARDRMLNAQQRLYELGIFRRVELVPMPGQERRSVRGLVVRCEEGAQRSYLVGIGWNETDLLRVTLGWSHLNLFGGAHALTAEARVSRTEERLQVGLREARLPKLDVPGYLVFFRTSEEIANFTYQQKRRGLWIDVGDRNKRPFRTWYRYEYQIVESDAPPNILPRELQEARISSITPTLEWDFRNDPLVPTRGTFSQVSLEWAFPLLDANSEFLKFWGRSTLYGRHSHGTWAAGIRVGAIKPFNTGTRSATHQFENRLVPLNTRYFAGGANSHRGFERDQLGIPTQTIDANGNPIGGNALVLINLQYERPVSDSFSTVAFVDIGNIWAEPSLVRFDDLRWTAGLGLWFTTPAGPLRAEYGWKLDRQPGESRGEFFLSFGLPF